MGSTGNNRYHVGGSLNKPSLYLVLYNYDSFSLALVLGALAFFREFQNICCCFVYCFSLTFCRCFVVWDDASSTFIFFIISNIYVDILLTYRFFFIFLHVKCIDFCLHFIIQLVGRETLERVGRFIRFKRSVFL